LRREVTRLRKHKLEKPDGEIEEPVWNEALLAFFADESAQRHLRSPLEPFPSPSRDTRTVFDQRTSAINVTDCGRNGPYDVNKIKEDALWLSKGANIDETVALRIVILEWQSRAGSKLLHDDIENENTTNDLPAFGASFRASSFLGQSVQFKSSLFSQDNKDKSFNSEDGRRSRLLKLFLEERLHVLRATDLLTRLYIELINIQTEPKLDAMYSIARNITQAICGNSLVVQAAENFLPGFVKILRTKIELLRTGSGWHEGSREDLETAWAQTLVDEMIALLQLWYSVLGRVYATAQTVSAFFNLISETMLLDIQIVSDATQCWLWKQALTMN
jgi:nuclear pore complex protein Nup188